MAHKMNQCIPIKDVVLHSLMRQELEIWNVDYSRRTEVRAELSVTIKAKTNDFTT